jgi:hypothetical protein
VVAGVAVRGPMEVAAGVAIVDGAVTMVGVGATAVGDGTGAGAAS